MKKFLFLFFISGSVLASVAPPKEVVEGVFKKAAQPAVVSDANLQQEINESVDFNRMGRLVLGNEMKQIPSSEVVWFVNTLKEIITRTVYPEAPDFLSGVKIKYGEARVSGNRAVVKSSVTHKSDVTDVDYTLEQENNGSWKVVDVALDGESWVSSIRDQVVETLKREKWAGLKRKLSNRLAELKKSKSERT